MSMEGSPEKVNEFSNFLANNKFNCNMVLLH